MSITSSLELATAASPYILGLFGSSFNPPHCGHFALMHAAYDELGLNELQIIPTGQPWQKPHVLPAAQRVAMTELALQDDQHHQNTDNNLQRNLVLNLMEVEQNKPSYTYDTLTTLRARYPNAVLIWVLGSDQLLNFSTWHRWQDLLGLAHFAVAQRAGQEVAVSDLPTELQTFYNERLCIGSQWHNLTAGCFIPFEMPPILMSSSHIRQVLSEGGEPQGLSDAVLDYIKTNGLYLNRATVSR